MIYRIFQRSTFKKKLSGRCMKPPNHLMKVPARHRLFASDLLYYCFICLKIPKRDAHFLPMHCQESRMRVENITQH